jgi:hypothetical protein
LKLAGLRDFLGADYASVPLKPIGLRARNALKPWLIRLPQRAMSWRIETRDGRRFKLLAFGRSMRAKRGLMEEHLVALSGLDCVPALVWSDERHLLVEWVEGRTPRVDEPIFARRLAEAFAELYRVGFAWRPRSDLVSGLVEQVRPLFESGRLPNRLEGRLESRLSAALPESVPTAMLCGDQTLANFVLTPEHGLAMIDPGSFQRELPIDIFLAGGSLYDSIDRGAFHEAYAHAQGIDFPFTHREGLRLFHLARSSALQGRVLDRTPAVEVRRKRGLRRRLDAVLARLREALER